MSKQTIYPLSPPVSGSKASHNTRSNHEEQPMAVRRCTIHRCVMTYDRGKWTCPMGHSYFEKPKTKPVTKPKRRKR